MNKNPFPGLWSPTVKGHRYAYYRPDKFGQAIRITAEDGSHPLPGDPQFIDAYNALHKAAQVRPETAAAPPRSLRALIASYKSDEHWPELSDRTRRNYTGLFNMLDAAYGTAHVPALDRVRVLAVRKHFAKMVDGKATTPAQANNIVTALSVLVQHAIDIGWYRNANPCALPRKLKTGPGIRIWTPAEFDQFMAHPGVSEPLKRAVAVGYYTGLRIQDVVNLPRSARAGGRIETTPQKTSMSTGAKVWIDEHPALTAILDAAPASISPRLLTKSDGRPWMTHTLQWKLREAVATAGLPPLTFHGLRKAMTANLAEAGATDAEISAVVPHSAAMTRYYRAQADQKRLASSAIEKLRRSE